MKKTESRKQPDFSRKALDIVLAIDRVRDISTGPSAIFSGLTRVMCEFFNTAVCLLYVVDRETGAYILKVMQERDRSLNDLAESLSQIKISREIRDGDVFLWTAEDVLPEELAKKYADSLHIAALPVFMEQEPLGLLLMARSEKAFDNDEAELMRVAESQIDSAINQAYTYHELAMRNKELETIYSFDRIGISICLLTRCSIWFCRNCAM